MPDTSPARHANRNRLVLAVGFVVVAAVAGLWVPDSAGGSVDFAEYGAAARTLLSGGNPYDARTLLELQRPVGWADSHAQMMWNPPWVFPLVLPAGLLPWGAAFLAWDAVQFAAVLWACRYAWRVYRGRTDLLPPLLLAVSFAPVVFLLRLGQISGFLLFGLVAFLAGLRAGRPVWAGVGAAFTAVKPQLLLPFAVLFACDALVTPRTRKALVAGVLVLIAAALMPMIWNRHVWTDYLTALRQPTDEYHYSVNDWSPPILAGHLRDLVGGGVVVQFLPSVVASVGLVVYWWGRRRTWDWAEQLPRVVLISLLTTGYGAWGFDLCLLLLPVVQGFAWAANSRYDRLVLWAVVGYLVLTCVMLTGLLPALWWTPAVALGYLALSRAVRGCSEPVPGEPGRSAAPSPSAASPPDSGTA